MKPCNLDGCTGYSMFDTCDAHSSEKVVFDRGFKAGYDAGFGMAQKAFDTAEFLERSRIIKLLEERYAENVDHCEWGTHVFLDDAIALIKGEK